MSSDLCARTVDQLASAMEADVQEHWTDEFYRRIDASDPGAAEFWSADIFLQCGNFPPTRGLEAAAFGPFRRVVDAMSSVRHEVLDRWDVSADEVIYRFNVHYVRGDGRSICLPAITTLRRNDRGLIDDLRLYMDSGPLFEGLTARLVGAVARPLGQQSGGIAEDRSRLAIALLGYAADPASFDLGVSDCQILEQAELSTSGQRTVRELVIDGQRIRENVVVLPHGAATITSMHADLLGDTHITLENMEGRPALALQFDLTWHGMPAHSILVDRMRERLIERGCKLLDRLASELSDDSEETFQTTGQKGPADD